jgi:hypothetical protein
MAEKEASERYEEASRQLEAFAKAPRPIVFQFQPERFEVVTGDRLQEWDRLMRTRVGLQVEAGGISCLPSISYCGPSFEDACDCDCV